VQQVNNPIGSFPEAPLKVQRTKSDYADIKPGFREMFCIGHRVEQGIPGGGDRTIMADRAEIVQCLTAFEHVSFFLEMKDQAMMLLRNDGIRIELAVYGEDITHVRHRFIINAKNKFELLYEGVIPS
jgi:hypothetical protein